MQVTEFFHIGFNIFVRQDFKTQPPESIFLQMRFEPLTTNWTF